jgi:hypothetical protein
MNDVDVQVVNDGVCFSWSHWQLAVDLDKFHSTAHGTAAELTVRKCLAGSHRTLTQGILNLSSFSAREQLIKRLHRLHEGPEWNIVLETVCVRGLREYRKGTPSESLEPQAGDEPAYFVCNPLLYARHPTLIYGPGESGKSLLALYVGCLLSSGGTSSALAVAPDGHNVLYLDWELRAPEMRARVKQLRAGHPELTKAPQHRAMHLPLAACIAEVQREVREHDIGVVIIDSLGPATGGEIERASDPVAFFSALGSLHCSTLLIGHVAKSSDDEKTRTPYGSVYYYNLARSIWEVRLAAETDSDERTIALYHRKNNLGRRLPPLGYTLTINDHSAHFAPCDPTEEPELVRGLSVRERIRQVLADHEIRTVHAIADAVGADLDTVRRTLQRYKNRLWISLQSDGKKEGTWAIVYQVGHCPTLS